MRRQTPDARRQKNRWIEAARVRTLPAAIVPVLIGSSAAYRDDAFDGLVFALVLIGALAIQIAANFANDASDAARGIDTEDRLGPPRMVAAGLISSRAMWTATWTSVLIAAVCGIGLALISGPVVIVIGVASILAMLGYVGGPLPYGYRGLGELFVFLFFGLIATGGSRLVYDGHAPLWVWGLGVPVGMLAAAILVANNLRDIETDARTGKRTLAVMLGVDKTRQLYVSLLWGAHVVTVLMAVLRFTPPPSVAGILSFPLIRPLVQTARTATAPHEWLRLLAGTARLHLVYGLFVATALLVVPIS